MKGWVENAKSAVKGRTVRKVLRCIMMMKDTLTYPVQERKDSIKESRNTD